MKTKYTTDTLKRLFVEALTLFNDCLDSGISEENTVIVCCTCKQCPTVYEEICTKYFPKHLSENYKEPGYFDYIAAMAFVGKTHNGILIRTDTPLSEDELFFVFLHELSHIFCTKNEIKGDNFFDKFCMSSGVEDGMMNAGYAIWREAVADIMADSIASEYALFSLLDISDEVVNLYDTLGVSNPDSKKQMAIVIAQIMSAREVAGTTNWKAALNAIKREIPIGDHLLWGILEHVFIKLHTSPFWEITPEFIFDLGDKYLTMLSTKFIREQL